MLDIENQYKMGFMTEHERYKQVVQVWEKTTNDVSDALQKNLDRYNPIFMMADSGARGSMKQIRQLAAIIAALTVLALGGAWLLGIPVLSLLYSNLSYALKSCRPALLLIILGGALNAFMNLFYYSLIIMKKQRLILLGYGLTALLAVLFSDGFVIWGGIFGGALIYVLLQAALTAVFALSAGMVFKKKKGEVG